MESKKKLFKARVLSFVDPHLFWLIKKSDILKRNELDRKLKAALEKPTKTEAMLEKHVAVYDGIWKRAIIKAINDNKCSCWLEDYGYLLTANNVYELPKICLSDPPPLAFQACFHNMVPLKSHLSSEQIGVKYTETDAFSSGATYTVFKHISRSVDIVVECEDVCNGIYQVNLLVETKNCEIVDLKDVMIKNHFALENKDLFNKVVPKFKLTTEKLLAFFKNNLPLNEQFPDEVNVNVPLKDMRARRVKFVSSKFDCMDIIKNTIDDTDTDKDTSDAYSACSSSISEDMQMVHSFSDISINSNTETNNDMSSNSTNEVVQIEKGHSLNNSTTNEDHGTTEKGVENFWEDDERKEIKSLNIYPETSFFNLKKKSSKTKKVDQVSKSESRCTTSSPENLPSTSCQKITFKKSSLSPNTNVYENKSTVEVDENDKSKFHNKNSTECKLAFGNECKCKDCKTWNGVNTSWFDDKIVFDSSEQKSHRSAAKPKPFLKQNCEENNHNFAVQSLTYQAHSRLELEYLPPVLVHGCLINEPAKKISDVAFHPSVERVLLRSNVNTCRHIQSYTWPAILKNLNVCAVGGPKTGKTMMYLPCVATILMENGDVFKKLPNIKGPVIIIMCPTIKNLEKVNSDLDTLLTSCRNTGKVALSVPPFDDACLGQFKKPYDVLITTPSTLNHLLSNQIVSLKRLCHIIFDDFDKILDEHYREIDSLLEIIQNVIEHRICEVSVQYIITAKCWTKKLEMVIKKLNVPPFICIGAPLEAALYGKLIFDVRFVHSSNKENELIEIVKNKSQFMKTVILCDCDEEVLKLTYALQHNCVPVLKIESHLTRLEINDLVLSWLNYSSGEYLVLICTDVLFHNASIRNADILINYSLPSSFSDFTNRYRILLDKYSSSIYDLKHKNDSESKSYVLIDEKCEEKIIRFISFLQKMGVSVPEKFIQYQQDYILQGEKQKCEHRIHLCHRIKTFGKCLKEKCEKRHMLDKYQDATKINPQSGLVKFKITSLHTINHYTIRLINDASDVDDNDDIQTKLEQTLKERKIYAEDIKQGDWLIYYDNSLDNKPRRCEILQILKTDNISKQPTLCKIKLLDSAEEVTATDATLFELPEEFKKIPPEGIHMYLGNLIPPFSDTVFSSHSNKILKKKFEAYKNSVFIGEILLQLGNILWMKNVRTWKHLPLYDLEVCEFDLSDFVIKNKLAENSSEPLSLLSKLCENAGIGVPIIKEEKNKNVSQIIPQFKPQWAFMEQGTYQDVWLTYVETPNSFFVHLDKFKILINRLENDMIKLASSSLYKKADKVLVNQYYIAKLNDNCRRVKVIRVNNKRIAKCFCVDYGECIPVNTSNLFPIKKEMITSLPFQAIQCRLFGITAIDEWCERDAKHLWQFCGTPNKPLCAWTEKIENDSDKESPLYSVLLSKDCGDVTLNQILVDSGIAKILEHEYYDIYTSENIENNGCSTENDSEYFSEDEDTGYSDNSNCHYTTMEDILKLEEEIKKFDANDLNLDEFDFYDSRFADVLDPIQQKPKNKKTESNCDGFVPMVAAPNVDYFTPSLHWYQTDTNIIIKILLSGIQKHEYDIKLIRKRMLKFSANYQGKNYKLELLFFNAVNCKQFTSITEGIYIKVILTKVIEAKWPRLLASRDRSRNISYDPSHVCDDIDDDDDDNILSKIKKNLIKKCDDNEELEDGYIEELCDTDTTDSFSDEEISDS